MRKAVLVCASLLLVACSSPSDPAPAPALSVQPIEPLLEVRDSNDFGDGVATNDVRFPQVLRLPMYDRNRAGYKISPVMAQPENAYLCWFTAFGHGQVVVERIDLLVEGDRGPQVLYTQRWDDNQPIAGGHWLYTDQAWFSELIELGNNLPIFTRENGRVVINTDDSRHNEVHHLWLSTWPHLFLPPNTRRVGMRVIFQVLGDGLCHFGMDRYLTSTVQQPIKGRTVWEVMNSSTYGSEHGQVDRTIWTEVRIP